MHGSILVAGRAPVEERVGLPQGLRQTEGVQRPEGIGPEADRAALAAAGRSRAPAPSLECPPVRGQWCLRMLDTDAPFVHAAHLRAFERSSSVRMHQHCCKYLCASCIVSRKAMAAWHREQTQVQARSTLAHAPGCASG